jgi:hypothetical protein
MNELDPDLRRLLKWVRAASPSKSEQVPFGFFGRVLAAGKEGPVPTLFQELHRTAWGLSCVALGLILCGALVLISQRASPPSTEEFSLALSFLASNLPR